MQSIFRLPWSTDDIAPKMQTGKTSQGNMRASPVMDMSLLNKLKRKRVDSPEPISSMWVQPAKKSREDGDPFRHTLAKPQLKQELPAATPDLVAVSNIPAIRAQSEMITHQTFDQQTQVLGRPTISALDSSDIRPVLHLTQQTPAQQMPEDVTMTDAPPSVQAHAVDMTPLKQAIENGFNIQILMKHNELRLVEQELCKCQVALEQLRRCELRPFPGTQQLSASVSAGTGPSIAPRPGHTRPSHAAPYGVTDGPYASHYQQWLLRDPQFDSVSKHATSIAEVAPHDHNMIHALQPMSVSPASPHDRGSVNLSPHTVESNPGLVSDHEDDDHGSASEDEVPQAAIAHSLGVRVGRGDCTDGMELDVVEDDMDEHGVVIRRSSMLSAEDRGLRAAGSSSRKMGGGGGVDV
ncbi:hypothetical protein LTR48_002658 [Friedmanniomyces endolithicus]|uniref:Uncharacterized protein n=1 Tax=Rachicladosporium monterosium TaxID=1507873 RepID=A0ABR0LA86_9PEZI|nr:hypothetical protein LTR48_002658 [Friedmanniomyces endolithicus]KAK5145872.1 hypothetical protein LTR32_002439 [Rachicladosporium monterosium]